MSEPPPLTANERAEIAALLEQLQHQIEAAHRQIAASLSRKPKPPSEPIAGDS